MSNLGTITYTTEIETSQLVSGTKQADKSLDSLQKSFSDTDKSAQQLGGGLNKLATSIAGVLSAAAVVNEFKKAIAVTLEFNATISNLSALTGAVGKDLAVFRQAAIDIGGSTSLSASQAAEAMKLIGSASPELLKSAESLKSVTQQAVKLAEAAGSTLPEAAAALTGALNQFQLGADQAGRVINVLAAGAKEGASEINDTVEAMRNAGVVAAQAGVNFEQFNGAVQALAQGQIKGAEAGTGLRNILTILNTQAKSELKPSIVGLSTALANLEKAGLDDTQMVKLFGRENITTAKVLLQFRGTMDTVTKSITGTSEAYKQAAINQDNLKGDVAQLSSAFETLQIAIGDLSDSTLRDLTKQLTEVIGSFGANKDVIKDTLEAAGVAALSFAAIITGRVVAGLVGYASAQAKAVAATVTGIASAREAAAANLALATAEYNAAQAALAKQKAMVAANLGMQAGAADAALLAAANTRATAATVALNAATNASANVAGVAKIAFAGLRTVVGFLGGPVGVFLLAATAVYSFATSTRTAKADADALTGSLEKLSFAQLERSALASKEKITELSVELRNAQKDYADVLTGGALGNQEKYNEKLIASRARLDDINGSMKEQTERLAEIAKAQAGITAPKAQPAAVDPVRNVTESTSSEEGQKGIDALKEQLELAKLTGEAKARLQAIQKLGATATEKEKAEAAALGAEIYKLETATKTLGETNKKQKTEAEQLAKRAAAEEKRGIEQNIEVYTKLGAELAAVGQKARDVAMQQAELSLNEYATPEQIAQVRDMAGALYDLNQAKANKELLGQVDPAAGAQQSLEKQLKDLDTLRQAKMLSDQDYLTFKEQAETDYNARMMEIEAQRFAAQSAGNAAILAGLDALSTSGSQALAGLLSGTMSLRDAMGNIANTVLNSVIGSFVQMGTDWVKQEIMMMAATKAKEAATIGGIGAVTAAQAGATGTIAATTTATAATTGTAVATSMAPAAGLSSIASFGGAAVIGGAALLATMALAKAAGGRQYGGGVAAGGMYRVNETGAPEIFNAANGRQYMMPNTRGEVVSNKDATAGGGGAAAPIININNYGQGQATTSSKFSESDRRWVIDVTVGDAQANGKLGQTINQITGTKRAGS
jgi:TP901 family phage tail tape measure protein